jgi:hypothetical protein
LTALLDAVLKMNHPELSRCQDIGAVLKAGGYFPTPEELEVSVAGYWMCCHLFFLGDTPVGGLTKHGYDSDMTVTSGNWDGHGSNYIKLSYPGMRAWTFALLVACFVILK